MVGSDPGLTLRLLRTANSAALGLNREVTSLRQALVLIGPRRLRSWVVLTPARGRDDDVVLRRPLGGAGARVHLPAAGRAAGATWPSPSACSPAPPSCSAWTRRRWPRAPGVGAEARAALLDGEGSAGRALTAVLAHEADDADAIAATGLLPFDVSRTYLEALTSRWSSSTTWSGRYRTRGVVTESWSRDVTGAPLQQQQGVGGQRRGVRDPAGGDQARELGVRHGAQPGRPPPGPRSAAPWVRPVATKTCPRWPVMP